MELPDILNIALIGVIGIGLWLGSNAIRKMMASIKLDTYIKIEQSLHVAAEKMVQACHEHEKDKDQKQKYQAYYRSL